MSSTKAIENLTSTVTKLLSADPQLPRANPTAAFWQHIPHALANVQSDSLASQTDIVVIGSGITSASITKALLEQDRSSQQITILEARTLCSGATGRNGGHLISAATIEYAELTHHFGPEMAKKISAFTFANIKRMHEIAQEYGLEESELRDVTSIASMVDQETFEVSKASMALLEKESPELAGNASWVDGDIAAEKYNVTNVVGAMILPGGALWPYRLVTRIFAKLLELYPTRLTIETNTSVTSVQYKPSTSPTYPYQIHTSRGPILASRVIYCTNGHTGHLLPRLRGSLFPLRGTMTVQNPKNFPNLGTSRSWSFHERPSYDPRSQIVSLGLYYMTQNGITGDLFLGGETGTWEDVFCANDAEIGAIALKNLENALPQFFGGSDSGPNRIGWPEPPSKGVKAAWSGIMGYTADGAPLVGRVPYSVTGREGSRQEWIAAGFNGYGMVNCWLTGEALVSMILGDAGQEGQGTGEEYKEVIPEWFPEPYVLTEHRLDERLKVQGAVESLLNMTGVSGEQEKEERKS